MLGTIAGDVIGSAYEHNRIKHTDFPLFSPWSRFTDDTVLTIATAHALLTGQSYADAYHELATGTHARDMVAPSAVGSR